LLIGVTVSTFAVGYTLTGMNKGLEEFRPLTKQVDINRLPPGVSIEETNGHKTFQRDRFSYRDAQGQTITLPGGDYYVLNAINSPDIASGKYLYNPKTEQIEAQWIQGIGSERAPAPQAQLMSTVINGILTRKLPWGLVMLGVFLVVVVELLGIRSLAFAVGAYLSIGTTLAIFAGGAVRWMVDSAAKRAGETPAESEVSPGSLYASGLIAAGGIMGLAGIGVKLIAGADKPNPLDISSRLPAMGFGPVALNAVAVIAFLVLAGSLYYFARKPLESTVTEKTN
jgi:hypothetical protein